MSLKRPKADDPAERFSFVVDAKAEPGSILPPLAELLLDLAEQDSASEGERGQPSGGADATDKKQRPSRRGGRGYK
jgi:hypothetical protein